jgi:hypothetical protein
VAQAEGLRWRGDWETTVLASLRTTTLARRASGSMTLKKRKKSVSSIWCGMKKDGVNELEVDHAYLLVVFSQSVARRMRELGDAPTRDVSGAEEAMVELRFCFFWRRER